MHTIFARNVNDAWPKAIDYIESVGAFEPSRVGSVIVAPTPVTTVYSHPQERVLFDPMRDANPIFHLHEALWMLTGSSNAAWLDEFVHDFSQRFAEPGSNGFQHGAYGDRWRYHFGIDQINEVVRLLNANPYDRQAVIQMWDCKADLGVPNLKDRPCNTHIYLRVNAMKLDMAVMCRSNDIVWGCYGANPVHFSILQEYLAVRLGVEMGTLTQFSFNWHMYEATRHLTEGGGRYNLLIRYPGTLPLIDNLDTFDAELRDYIAFKDHKDWAERVENTFLREVAWPMRCANAARKKKEWQLALDFAADIAAPDWREATLGWLNRRKAHGQIHDGN